MFKIQILNMFHKSDVLQSSGKKDGKTGTEFSALKLDPWAH
jgi:hypothetical protein